MLTREHLSIAAVTLRWDVSGRLSVRADGKGSTLLV